MAKEQSTSATAETEVKAEVWGSLQVGEGQAKTFRLGICESKEHFAAFESALKANPAWSKITAKRMTPSEVKMLVAFLQPMNLTGWTPPAVPTKGTGFVKITGPVTLSAEPVKAESKRWHIFIGWAGQTPLWGHGMHWVPTVDSGAFLLMGSDKQQKRTYLTVSDCFKAAEEHCFELAAQVAGSWPNGIVFAAQDERVAAAFIQKVTMKEVEADGVYFVQRADNNVVRYERRVKAADVVEAAEAAEAAEETEALEEAAG